MSILDQIAISCMIAIGACTVLSAGLLLYTWWLLLDLRKEIGRFARRPEVLRDGEGKRIKERF